MRRDSSNDVPSRGRITKGLTRNALVERTLEFVRNELPGWRDDPIRPPEESEERLNAQLCKYLDVASRTKFPMVFFHHEEKQTKSRRVDVSASAVTPEVFGSTLYSIYDPFLVFEGKRLPPPNNSKRAREYVTGGDEKCGGIQRFKLGLHGAKHETAALIGYIQKGESREWLTTVNNWIRELAGALAFDEKWSLDEQLVAFEEDIRLRIAACTSQHPRVGEVVTKAIRLRHFWIKMNR